MSLVKRFGKCLRCQADPSRLNQFPIKQYLLNNCFITLLGDHQNQLELCDVCAYEFSWISSDDSYLKANKDSGILRDSMNLDEVLDFFVPLKSCDEGHSDARLRRVREHMDEDEILKTKTLLEVMDILIAPTEPMLPTIFVLPRIDKFRCNNVKCNEKHIQLPLKTCGGCKHAFYCGSVCQKVDWNNHKKICKFTCVYSL
jgi:hypothetical protein